MIDNLGDMQMAPENTKQISFQLRTEQTVSLLCSKDSLKIKLQSNDSSALMILFSETFNRLTSPQYGYDLSGQIKLPTPELQKAIISHFEIRKSLKESKKTLEDRSYQFRLIQKKLLNRFKDKNPSALNNLDFLLTHTYG